MIVSVAVAVKIALGLYVSRAGKAVNSDSLKNSGKDALMDSIISLSTIVAAAIFIAFGVSLEAWLGAVIAVLIVKSGLEMLFETISKLLGERAGAELARKIKSEILKNPDVCGVFDLVIHNYGPESYIASLHVEVDETLTAAEIDTLSRTIANDVYLSCGVILTAIGVYCKNTVDQRVVGLREDVFKIVLGFEHVLQIHGFYADLDKKTMRFDIIISFDAKDRTAVWQNIYQKLSEKYPDYTITIVLDTDFSEE